MSHFTIVPLSERPDFADTCAAWSYTEWHCQKNNPESLDSCVTRYRQRKAPGAIPCTWIATTNDKPAGMISLKADDHPDRTDLTPWFASLFVHPALRGKGIGKALSEHLIQQARDVYSLEKIYLITHTAEQLYAKMGFQKIGTLPDQTVISPEGDILMEKAL